MPKAVLRQEAIEDLNGIWIYTCEKWSEQQADKYYSTLKVACEDIGNNPKLGREYNEIRKNLLGLKSGRHIIFYQIINEDDIEIIRILHDQMDLKARMNE